MCISYDRILSITKSIYETLRGNYARYGIFLPINLKKGCFVILVKDNIDKNAKANLVKSHYHGTSIYLLQFPHDEEQGGKLDGAGFIDVSFDSKKLSPLPAEYTEPKKVPRPSGGFYAPLCMHNFEDLHEFPDLILAKQEEHYWFHQFVSSGDQGKSWAQYHAGESRSVPLHEGHKFPVTINWRES